MEGPFYGSDRATVGYMLSQGDAAPDFILPGTDGETVREYMLAEVTRSGPVVLAFYAFDFHPASVDLLDALARLDGPEDRPTARVLAVSTDSAFAHQAFSIEHGIGFPLLADSDGGVSETYDVLSDGIAGHRVVARPAVFLVDDETKVRYAWRADGLEKRPDRAEIERALDAL